MAKSYVEVAFRTVQVGAQKSGTAGYQKSPKIRPDSYRQGATRY